MIVKTVKKGSAPSGTNKTLQNPTRNIAVCSAEGAVVGVCAEGQGQTQQGVALRA